MLMKILSQMFGGEDMNTLLRKSKRKMEINPRTGVVKLSSLFPSNPTKLPHKNGAKFNSVWPKA